MAGEGGGMTFKKRRNLDHKNKAKELSEAVDIIHKVVIMESFGDMSPLPHKQPLKNGFNIRVPSS